MQRRRSPKEPLAQAQVDKTNQEFPEFRGPDIKAKREEGSCRKGPPITETAISKSIPISISIMPISIPTSISISLLKDLEDPQVGVLAVGVFKTRAPPYILGSVLGPRCLETPIWEHTKPQEALPTRLRPTWAGCEVLTG